MADPSRSGTNSSAPTPSPQNPLELNQTAAVGGTASTPAAAASAAPTAPPVHPSGRHLSSSNSFDSKSHLPAGFPLSFQMPLEATRLMNTLQQSPLPLQQAQNAPTTTTQDTTYRYHSHQHAQHADHQQQQQQMMGKEKMPNFGDLARNTPPLRDYLHSYSYLQGGDCLPGGDQPSSLQPRHNQITQQYSSSTDEGCDTDHGGEWLLLLLFIRNRGFIKANLFQKWTRISRPQRCPCPSSD